MTQYDEVIEEVCEFLKKNGWTTEGTSYDTEAEYMYFHKEGNVSIDISDDEIVFIDDSGDFAHIEMNSHV